MKLNIDETNDHLAALCDTALRETTPPAEISFEDWRKALEHAPDDLYMLACESSIVVSGPDYDTDNDLVVLNTLRAWLRLRSRQVAPNGIY